MNGQLVIERVWLSSQELSHSWQPRFVLFLLSEDPGLSPLYSTEAQTNEMHLRAEKEQKSKSSSSGL